MIFVIWKLLKRKEVFAEIDNKYTKNLVNGMLKQEEINNVDSLLRKNAGNPGSLWKTLKSLTYSNVHDGITLVLYLEIMVPIQKQVAEEFNKHCINSINELTIVIISNLNMITTNLNLYVMWRQSSPQICLNFQLLRPKKKMK